MKSFAEFVEMKEGVLGHALKSLKNPIGAYRYYTQEQSKLELDARIALKAVIKNLAKSNDPKLKYLYNGGYAGELFKIFSFLRTNRTSPKTQQQPQQAQTQQPQAQTQESIGQAIGNWAGQSGLLGGLWNKVTRSKDMTQHNELENQAIKALQALTDRVNYEKGQDYYGGLGSRLQWYVNWMKKAQTFNNSGNMGVDYESPPENYISYRKVKEPQLRTKRVYTAGQQLPGSAYQPNQPNQPKRRVW